MVGVFEDFRGESSEGRCETLVKVGDGLSLAEVELVLDLNVERVAWPGVQDGLPGIPFPESGVVELGEQGDDVEPGQFVRQCRLNWGGWQLVSRLLTNWGRRQF